MNSIQMDRVDQLYPNGQSWSTLFTWTELKKILLHKIPNIIAIITKIEVRIIPINFCHKRIRNNLYNAYWLQFILTIILGYCSFFLILILFHMYYEEDVHSWTLSMQSSSTLSLITLLSIRDFSCFYINRKQKKYYYT